MESLADESRGRLDWCRDASGCGKSVHRRCLQVWAKHHRRNSATAATADAAPGAAPDAPLPCPWCRAPWGELALPPPLTAEEMREGQSAAARRAAARRGAAGAEAVHYGVRCSGCGNFGHTLRDCKGDRSAVAKLGGKSSGLGPSKMDDDDFAMFEAVMESRSKGA